MDYKTGEKKLEDMIEKEISDYKKLVGKLPEDERILSFLPVLARYEDNIYNLIDVYASAKSLRLVGRKITYTEKKDGSLHYQTGENKVSLKKNNQMYG